MEVKQILDSDKSFDTKLGHFFDGNFTIDPKKSPNLFFFSDISKPTR